MNVQIPKNDLLIAPKEPTNFVEATVSLAHCYQSALAAGAEGDEDTTRFWVDASRSIKSFFTRYEHAKQKSNMLAGLEASGNRELMINSLKVLDKAGHFISSWAGKFRALKVRDFSEFESFHWDIFLDEVIPLTWDFQSDVFIIQYQCNELIEHLLRRGQLRILVIESNTRKANKVREYLNTLENSKFVYVLKENEEIKRYMGSWIDKPPQVARVISSDVLPTEEGKEKELVEIEEIAREGMLTAITFDSTIRKHDQTWIQNGLSNFESLINFPNVRCLNNKFRNSSVIIVSPGPSLEKNVDFLKAAKGKAIIVAVSHSLEFLQSRNIMPDVVMHVDPNVNIKRYFEGFPIEEVELLILAATTGPGFYDLPSKNKAWLYANAYFDNWLMELLGIEDYTLWGSCVSICAAKLAYMWGCKNIALIGQDLSFKEGEYYAGNTYAPEHVISTFEQSVEQDVFKLPGYYGGEVLTKNDYRLYHGQFLTLAIELKKKKKKLGLYNCTEGGADIKGFTNCSLQSFVTDIISKDLKNSPKSFEADIKRFLVETVDKAKVRNAVKQTKRALTDAEKLLQEALSKSSISKTTDFDSASLNLLQNKIAKKLKASMFLKIALQDALGDASAAEGYEHNQEGYLKKTSEMYRACLGVIQELRFELNEWNLR